MNKQSNLSIIWNVTYKCPWHCAFCVMDSGKNCHKAELTPAQREEAIKNLDIDNLRIDLSGGEVMLDLDNNKRLITLLAQKFGPENLGISSSGYHIDEETSYFLAKHISEFEMTMDAVPSQKYKYRQDNYHKTAGEAVRHLKHAGIKTGLQTVLTREHLEHPEILDQLHAWMVENGVDDWSLIRYFASGRGEKFPKLVMNEYENLQLVNHAKELCKNGPGPKLDIHYLLPGTNKETHCRCVRKSIGILPNGDVSSCFWGLDDTGSIKDSKYYLGNILETPLSQIMQSKNALYWKNYCGNCPLNGN